MKIAVVSLINIVMAQMPTFTNIASAPRTTESSEFKPTRSDAEIRRNGKCYKKNITTITTTITTTTTTTLAPEPTLPPPPPPTVPAPSVEVPAPPKTGGGSISPATGGSKFPGSRVGLMSWFQANKDSDNTNGNSWCGYPYKDYTPGFAPPLLKMTEGTGAVWGNPLWDKYAKESCGLEAKVCTAAGVCKILYIVDAFEPGWVRTEDAIDVMAQAFQELTNGEPLNKMNVKHDTTWTLTGNRSDKYCFKCSGDP